MDQATTVVVATEDRTLAALTHLSGLSGYLVPLGGAIVPIVIWAVNKESPIISSIAKQALLLNVMVYLLIAVTAVLWITIILIPAVVIFWLLLMTAAVVLPIVGALKANQGTYYRYPVIGVQP